MNSFRKWSSIILAFVISMGSHTVLAYEKDTESEVTLAFEAYKACLLNQDWIGDLEKTYQMPFRKFALQDLNEDGIPELLLKEYNEQNEPGGGDGYSAFFEYDRSSGTVKQIPVKDFMHEGMEIPENLLACYYGPMYDSMINCLVYTSGEQHQRLYYRYENNSINAYKSAGVGLSTDSYDWIVYDPKTNETDYLMSSEFGNLFGDYEGFSWYDFGEDINVIMNAYTTQTKDDTVCEDKEMNFSLANPTIEDFLGAYAAKNNNGISLNLYNENLSIIAYIIAGRHQAIQEGGTRSNNLWTIYSYEINQNVLTVSGRINGVECEIQLCLNEDGTLDVKGTPFADGLYYPWVENTPVSIMDITPGDFLQVQNCLEYTALQTTPENDSEEIAKLPLGAAVEFLRWARNGYYGVKYNGQMGYVKSDYLVMQTNSPTRITEITSDIDSEITSAIDTMMPALRTVSYGYGKWDPSQIGLGDLLLYGLSEYNSPHMINHGLAFSEEEVKEIMYVLDPEYDGAHMMSSSSVEYENGYYYVRLAQPEEFRVEFQDYALYSDGSLDIRLRYYYYEGSPDGSKGTVDIHLVPNDTLNESSILKLPYRIASVVRDDTAKSGNASSTNTNSNSGASSRDASSDYVIWDSDSRELTEADLAGLTEEQLRIARNEIYARKGRKFKSDDLNAYFNSKSWYSGTILPDNFKDEEMLNDYEYYNACFILKYEERFKK